NGRSTAIGGFVFFGDDTDDKMEIAQVRSYDSGTGEATLNRGVLDTVPRDWPEGTPVWYASGRFYDSKFFAGGEAVNAKLLTRTSRGILDAAEAPVITFDVLDRPHLPSRPANVKANTTAFGTLDAIALSNFTVTWARRNRLFEDTVVLKWDEADTAPEAGQTTNVILLDADDRSVVHTYGGIVGTSQVVTKSHFGTAVDGIVRVVAERDGLESLQGHEIIVQVRERLFIDLGDAPASYAGHAYDFVRVNAAGTGLSFVPAPKVQLAIFRPSVFDNAEVLTRYISVEAWKLRSNLAGCKVNVGLAAFGSPVITIKKNGALVATISITGSTPTLATSGGTEVSFAIGDILDLAGPAVADSSLGNVSIVLSGIKG
ncbi:MAG TPA: hypothetical protein VEC60_15140, partial [Reyranella sp.]|nr:hypothetical protein [Reyranella sp.]